MKIPTDRTVEGPRFLSQSGLLHVDYDFERDDGTVIWQRVTFREVLLFQYRSNVCSRAEDVLAPRVMRLTTDSEFRADAIAPWQRSVGWHEYQKSLGGVDRFVHYTVYFDDAGSVDVVASGYDFAPPAE